MTIPENRGPDFYDDEKVFEIYSSHRDRADNPNITMEQPSLWELIGNPEGLAVLDLGCGDARIAKKFRSLGARSYLGVDGSHRMLEKAKANLEPGYSDVVLSWLEDFTLTENSFDLLVSSLALHYIEDLGKVLKKAYRALKSGGRLVFSVEHPVITSCNKSLEHSPVRQAWVVDNYFERGARNVQWMGSTVTKYHRTVEDFVRLIAASDLKLKSLKESEPAREHFDDDALWARRRRIPLFLILEAVKD
jgi:ubiquinone/menaquinone biosynthesis C-methylase UbiE